MQATDNITLSVTKCDTQIGDGAGAASCAAYYSIKTTV